MADTVEVTFTLPAAAKMAAEKQVKVITEKMQWALGKGYSEYKFEFVDVYFPHGLRADTIAILAEGGITAVSEPEGDHYHVQLTW